jgi:two-component system nitrate/nitrite response regulator NarL
MATRTCLVGGRKLVRAGLRHILSNEAFEVVREVGALSECREIEKDWELLIIDRPDDAEEIDGDIRRLKTLSAGLRLVLLAESMDGDRVAGSFVAGVDGYLLADISPEALCESLRLVMLGEKVFPSRLVALFAGWNWAGQNPIRAASNAGSFLSDREVAIVSRLTGGMPNKVIASELTITEATVKVHLKSIMKKIGVSNRTQAAIWAINNGVAETTRYDG